MSPTQIPLFAESTRPLCLIFLFVSLRVVRFSPTRWRGLLLFSTPCSCTVWCSWYVSLQRSTWFCIVSVQITRLFTVIFFQVLYKTAWSESVGRDCTAFCAKKCDFSVLSLCSALCANFAWFPFLCCLCSQQVC